MIAPPFVSRPELGRPAIERMQVALRRVFEDPRLKAEREALLLAGVRFLPGSSYDEIRSSERTALLLRLSRAGVTVSVRALQTLPPK